MRLRDFLNEADSDQLKVTVNDYNDGIKLAKSGVDKFDEHVANIAKKHNISKEAALKGLDKHDKHKSFEDAYYAPNGQPS